MIEVKLRIVNIAIFIEDSRGVTVLQLRHAQSFKFKMLQPSFVYIDSPADTLNILYQDEFATVDCVDKCHRKKYLI